MKHTILAWNNRRILVEYVICDAKLSGSEESIEIEMALKRMQKSLNHKSGDHRWQLLPGLAVVRLPPVERKQR